MKTPRRLSLRKQPPKVLAAKEREEFAQAVDDVIDEMEGRAIYMVLAAEILLEGRTYRRGEYVELPYLPKYYHSGNLLMHRVVE